MPPARVGDWLVEPGPLSTRMWRWGRVVAIPPETGFLLVRWLGDDHDTIVAPSSGARIEGPGHDPRCAGDAAGLLPAV